MPRCCGLDTALLCPAALALMLHNPVALATVGAVSFLTGPQDGDACELAIADLDGHLADFGLTAEDLAELEVQDLLCGCLRDLLPAADASSASDAGEAQQALGLIEEAVSLDERYTENVLNRHSARSSSPK